MCPSCRAGAFRTYEVLKAFEASSATIMAMPGAAVAMLVNAVALLMSIRAARAAIVKNDVCIRVRNGRGCRITVLQNLVRARAAYLAMPKVA
jgi:hypothetical protein